MKRVRDNVLHQSIDICLGQVDNLTQKLPRSERNRIWSNVIAASEIDDFQYIDQQIQRLSTR